MANKLQVENPALAFIGTAEPEQNHTEPIKPEPLKPEAIAPAKKSSREVRLNLLLSISNKLKLQKMVEREGYKSVNDYINYLIAVAVQNEPEPTAAEIRAYKRDAEARKK